MNKPVAWIGITANGFQRLSIEKLDENDIPLYNHPVKELTETNYETVFDGEKYTTKLVEPLVKELTDEEILEVWRENERVYPMDRSRLLDRTRACIKKASEK